MSDGRSRKGGIRDYIHLSHSHGSPFTAQALAGYDFCSSSAVAFNIP